MRTMTARAACRLLGPLPFWRMADRPLVSFARFQAELRMLR
jgi:hypothetical protein